MRLGGYHVTIRRKSEKEGKFGGMTKTKGKNSVKGYGQVVIEEWS